MLKRAASRRVGFRMDNTTKENKWKFTDMMELLGRPDGLTVEDCRKGLARPISRFPTTAKGSRALATWLVAMWTLIQKYPHYFPVNSDDPDAKKLLSIDLENWHRAFHAVKQTWREDLKSRKEMKGETVGPVPSRPQAHNESHEDPGRLCYS